MPNFSTFEKDTFDLWVRLLGPAHPTTIPDFLDQVRDEQILLGRSYRPVAEYQRRMACVALVDKGALVTDDPDTTLLMARKYRPVAPPPWGPRRPGARVHPPAA